MNYLPTCELLPQRDGKLGTVLIVDDDTICLQVMARCLQAHFHIITATDGEGALAAIAASQPDLVMLDVFMPGLDGYQVCMALRRDENTRHIPVIFLTGASDTASEARGLDLGAVDYLTKPFTPALVLGRVRNHVELKRSRDQLAAIAMLDGLTGIPNRRRFDAALGGELRRVARMQEDIGLLMLDVDHFKAFNDTYGHLQGDDCLRRVAQAIAGCVERPFDLVARYGGEEFGCILPCTSLEGTLKVAQRILDAVAGLAIPHAASSAGTTVSVSIGAAYFHCAAPASPAELIRVADEQLYRAKKTGRARICAMAMEAGLATA
jgi:diguanylate cyclase (GGDEF)-like protein